MNVIEINNYIKQFSNFEDIALFLEENENISEFWELLITTACNVGNLDCLELFLNDSRFDPTFNNNTLVGICLKRHQVLALEMLIEDSRVNPADNNCEYLMWCFAELRLSKIRTIFLNKHFAQYGFTEDEIIEFDGLPDFLQIAVQIPILKSKLLKYFYQDQNTIESIHKASYKIKIKKILDF